MIILLRPFTATHSQSSYYRHVFGHSRSLRASPADEEALCCNRTRISRSSSKRVGRGIMPSSREYSLVLTAHDLYTFHGGFPVAFSRSFSYCLFNPNRYSAHRECSSYVHCLLIFIPINRDRNAIGTGRLFIPGLPMTPSRTTLGDGGK